ncbi:MAG: serine/threonine-protein kinase [Planctomycetaceae bacterium]
MSSANSDAATSADSGKKPVQLGDFLLTKKLGQGGMGAVYLGHQISLDRECAIKIMSRDLAKKPGFQERFLREARAMAKIHHPNVVSCYAVGEEKGNHYVAMELIAGRSMQDWLDQLKIIPIADAVLVTLVCGEALVHAHKLKMIHRDIKPDNILVTKTGVIKVADLGLAKATDEDMSMTQSGTGLGTPHYMPPEQARNAKHVDHRCDVYALGSTLYHMVTGTLPFSGDSIVELITNKEQGKYQAANRVNSAVPERLSLMIDKSMMKDPAHRYQTMQDFVNDLESLGLASESLSFLDHPEKVVARRSGGATQGAIGGGMQTRVGTRPANLPPATSAADVQAKRTSVADADKEWYVKTLDSNGRIKIGKMPTGQILAALKTDKLDPKTQVAVSKNGPFLPVAQVPIFEDDAKKMLTRAKANSRDQGLKAAYAEIDKQYGRRKWWRILERWRDGTLGFIGLLVYLAAVVALVVVLGWFVYSSWDAIAAKFGLNG